MGASLFPTDLHNASDTHLRDKTYSTVNVAGEW